VRILFCRGGTGGCKPCVSAFDSSTTNHRCRPFTFVPVASYKSPSVTRWHSHFRNQGINFFGRSFGTKSLDVFHEESNRLKFGERDGTATDWLCIRCVQAALCRHKKVDVCSLCCIVQVPRTAGGGVYIDGDSTITYFFHSSTPLRTTCLGLDCLFLKRGNVWLMKVRSLTVILSTLEWWSCSWRKESLGASWELHFSLLIVSWIELFDFPMINDSGRSSSAFPVDSVSLYVRWPKTYDVAASSDPLSAHRRLPFFVTTRPLLFTDRYTVRVQESISFSEPVFFNYVYVHQSLRHCVAFVQTKTVRGPCRVNHFAVIFSASNTRRGPRRVKVISLSFVQRRILSFETRLIWSLCALVVSETNATTRCLLRSPGIEGSAYPFYPGLLFHLLRMEWLGCESHWSTWRYARTLRSVWAYPAQEWVRRFVIHRSRYSSPMHEKCLLRCIDSCF
jgi:hypothetical protein